MYEKPQYLTPKGYRRAGDNPNKPSGIKPSNPPEPSREIPLAQQVAEQKKQLQEIRDRLASTQGADSTSAAPQKPAWKKVAGLRNKPAISEKAAQLIAMAIKSMLKG